MCRLAFSVCSAVAKHARLSKISSVMPQMLQSRGIVAFPSRLCLVPSFNTQKVYFPKLQSLHTEADKELEDFLKEELKYEMENKNQRGSVQELKGFEVQGNGADVKLVKDENGEKICITFNVNNSVDADDSMEMEQSGQPPQMVSRPSFTVEICKGGNSRLVLDCQFTRQEEGEATAQTEEQKEVFEIVEAWMQEGELEESTYVISSDNMDGTLYDILINIMCDRGLDDAFVSQMAEFATHYEHGKYIDFLHKLQSFAARK